MTSCKREKDSCSIPAEATVRGERLCCRREKTAFCQEKRFCNDRGSFQRRIPQEGKEEEEESSCRVRRGKGRRRHLNPQHLEKKEGTANVEKAKFLFLRGGALRKKREAMCLDNCRGKGDRESDFDRRGGKERDMSLLGEKNFGGFPFPGKGRRGKDISRSTSKGRGETPIAFLGVGGKGTAITIL